MYGTELNIFKYIEDRIKEINISLCSKTAQIHYCCIVKLYNTLSPTIYSDP